MKFQTLTVTNFGPFRGEHTFQFEPRSNGTHTPPIVLFGGQNGSGKTTILEAIRLCLYGRAALGSKVRIIDYENDILSRFHRGTGNVTVDNSMVKLNFEYVHWGNPSEYEVTRSWSKKGNSISELLEIRKNGEPVREGFPGQLQLLINDLLPLGVAELSFVDGEKVHRLVEENGHNPFLADSINKLLGLDMIDRLHIDLDITIRNNRKGSSEEIENMLDEIQSELDLTNTSLAQEKNEHEQALDTLENLNSRIVTREQKLAAEGGDFAKHREGLIAEKSKHLTLIAETENEIRELSSGLLPFCYAPQLVKSLYNQLEAEAEYTRWSHARDILEDRKTTFLESFDADAFWQENTELGKWSPRDSAKLPYALNHFIAQIMSSADIIAETEIIHGISEKDSRNILNWIEVAKKEYPNRVRTASAKLKQAKQDLLDIEENLMSGSPDEVIKPLVDEIGQLQVESGKIQQESERLENSIHTLERQKEDLIRRQLSLEAKRQTEKGDEQLIELGQQVQTVLADYGQSVRSAKVGDLEQSVGECLQILSRKKGAFQNVRFDPTTFAVTLLDSKGTEVLKERLSEGEKHIYAVAMLWGLIRSSGRPLPIFADTPLANLDSVHRRNLVTRFYPKASHQVIIFSTDTEVDKKALDMLEPWISHRYHLEYDTTRSETDVEERYFTFNEGE